MNYSALVSKFRELARDYLRMVKINRTKDSILLLDNEIAEVNKSIDRLKKAITRASYALAHLDAEHPDFDDDKKDCEAEIKQFTEEIASIEKRIESLNKLKAEEEEIIAKVTSGEIKVQMDALSTETEKLAKEFIKNEARMVIEDNLEQ